MKHFICSAILALMVVSVCSAQPKSDHASPTAPARYIINSSFYSEIPEPIEGTYSLGRITLPDGTSLFVITTPEPLSDWSLSLAIPAEEVPGSGEALQLATEAKLMEVTVNNSRPRIIIGENFPASSLTDTDGNKIALPSESGRPMLLHFWFTGCNPCKKEMPEISQWIELYPAVDFVAVTYNTAEEIAGIVENRGFRFRQVAGDTGKALTDTLHVGTFPTNIIIDGSGIVRLVEVGTSPKQKHDICELLGSL